MRKTYGRRRYLTEKILFNIPKALLSIYFLTQSRKPSLDLKCRKVAKWHFLHFFLVPKPMIQVVNKICQVVEHLFRQTALCYASIANLRRDLVLRSRMENLAWKHNVAIFWFMHVINVIDDRFLSRKWFNNQPSFYFMAQFV